MLHDSTAPPPVAHACTVSLKVQQSRIKSMSKTFNFTRNITCLYQMAPVNMLVLNGSFCGAGRVAVPMGENSPSWIQSWRPCSWHCRASDEQQNQQDHRLVVTHSPPSAPSPAAAIQISHILYITCQKYQRSSHHRPAPLTRLA